MNRPGSAAQSGSEMNRSGSLRTYLFIPRSKHSVTFLHFFFGLKALTECQKDPSKLAKNRCPEVIETINLKNLWFLSRTPLGGLQRPPDPQLDLRYPHLNRPSYATAFPLAFRLQLEIIDTL